MNLFGCKFCEKSEDSNRDCDRKNFDSLLWAIVTVFQVLLLNWTFSVLYLELYSRDETLLSLSEILRAKAKIFRGSVCLILLTVTLLPRKLCLLRANLIWWWHWKKKAKFRQFVTLITLLMYLTANVLSNLSISTSIWTDTQN